MSFAAGKRLDVIIIMTIMKTVQCYVSCPLRYAKREGPKFFGLLRSRNPHLQNRGATLARVKP